MTDAETNLVAAILTVAWAVRRQPWQHAAHGTPFVETADQSRDLLWQSYEDFRQRLQSQP